jgi:hypothetical protein
MMRRGFRSGPAKNQRDGTRVSVAARRPAAAALATTSGSPRSSTKAVVHQDRRGSNVCLRLTGDGTMRSPTQCLTTIPSHRCRSCPRWVAHQQQACRSDEAFESRRNSDLGMSPKPRHLWHSSTDCGLHVSVLCSPWHALRSWFTLIRSSVACSHIHR